MMKLSLIIFPFILFNYDVGIARITDNEPGMQTQGIEEVDREWNAEDREYGCEDGELGFDEGEGKGEPFDETDEENANAIDLETEIPPGEDPILENIEDTYKQHNHSRCFFEGDILINPDEVDDEDRSATTRKGHLWDKYNGFVHVPYIISSSYSRNERANILAAVQQYAKYTCIRWVQMDSSNSHYYKDYISIFRGRGCYSMVGCQRKGKQYLSLGNGCATTVGTPVHEMMHAMGYWHEQSRPDRDRYVDVYLGNVEADKRYNFETCKNKGCVTQNLPYDYKSVMHYPNKAFSVNGGVTLARKGCGSRTTGECQLGQYNGFSASDVKGLNILYGCSDSGTGGGGGGGGEDCADKNTNCPNWAKGGYCTGQYEGYMTKNCAKSCKKCGSSGKGYYLERRGQTSCSNGNLIKDGTECRKACDHLKIPKQSILGSYVCYKDARGYCYQDGWNGSGASMVCTSSSSAAPGSAAPQSDLKIPLPIF